MKKIPLIIASAWFWFILFFISALLFPVALILFLITVAFDKKRVILHYFSCMWSEVVIWLNPIWKMRVTGRKKVVRERNYIMVANHSSGADILLLYKMFIPFKWVAKRSLFFYPFIGWNMYLNAYIPIERTKGRSKLQMMDKAAQAVRSGNSVLIFPEGTRTRDGKLQPFKTGSFRLALETETPILPIAITGTFTAIQKGGVTIHPSRNIRAVILDPVPFEQFRNMDPKQISNFIREKIRREIESQTLL